MNSPLPKTLLEFEKIIREAVKARAVTGDPAHDFLHFGRVVKIAKRLATELSGNMWVVIPAAWMHDWVQVPKNHPDRSKASMMAAKEALTYLSQIDYPQQHFAEISHAIESHSFSAEVKANTLEAQIVQDADRLDGVGAIGIARLFATGALMGSKFYHPEDAFNTKERVLNDKLYSVDHFYVKLFNTIETLNTEAARTEGARRAKRMHEFLEGLRAEIE